MARSRSKVRTLRFAAKLSQSQHRRLDDVMGMQQQLYNAGLESWRTGYRMWQQSPDPGRAKMRFSYKDNCKTLAVLRAEDPGWAALDTRVGRGTLQRLDRAIRGFYSSGRGYPRFKARDRWRTVWVPDAHEGMLRRPGEGGKWWKLAVKGMPGLRFDGSRLDTLDDYEVRELRVVRTALRVELQVVIKEPAPEPVAVPQRPAGLDAGIKQRYTFCDGTVIAQRCHDRTKIKRCQRAVSRARKGSSSRREKVVSLRKEHTRQAEARRDEDFRLIAGFLEKYDGFAVEDLRVANMMRNRRLADKIAQQGWAAFADRLQHKAERAGLRFCRVNPSHTSQDCSGCGQRLKDKLTLRERIFVCPQCGLIICRDINAAVNICDRGFPPAMPGGEPPGVRRETNFRHKTNRPPTTGGQAQPERTKPHRKHPAAHAA